MAPKPANPTLFTERLNLLRHHFRPLGRVEPLSAREIRDGVKHMTGQSISESSIRYLINGERQPKLETAALLAKYFGVPTGFFTDANVSAIQADLDGFELMRQLREAKVTAVAARMAEVSDAELKAFAAFVTAEVSRRTDQDGMR